MAKRDIFNLGKGDYVSVYNRDYRVEQVSRLGPGNIQRLNYQVRDGSDCRWLCIRDYGGTLVVLGEEVRLETEVMAPQVVHQGTVYNLLDRGNARGVTTSNLGYPRYVNLDYCDYQDENKVYYLFVHKVDGKVTAVRGEPVIQEAVMVFPRPD